MKLTASGLRQSFRLKRRVFSRRNPHPRWKEALIGLGCLAVGTGLITGIQQLSLRLDTFLVFSESLKHLIEGLTALALGLVQLVGVLVLLLGAVGALFLIVAGLIRIGRSLLPAPQQNAAHPRGGPGRAARAGREQPLLDRRPPRSGRLP